MRLSGAREFLQIKDGDDEVADADLNDRLKVSTIGRNTMQKTMPAMNRSKGSLQIKDLKQGISLLNTSTDPMQESLFSKSI